MKRDPTTYRRWTTDAGRELLTSPNYIYTNKDARIQMTDCSFAELAELGMAIVDCLRDKPEGQQLAAYAMTMQTVAHDDLRACRECNTLFDSQNPSESVCEDCRLANVHP